MVIQGTDRAQGHQVRHGKHCRNIRAVLEQVFHGGISALQRKPGIGILLFHLERQAKAEHSALAAGQTGQTGAGLVWLAADQPDLAVALRIQVLNHQGRCRNIVHADAGQVGDVQGCGAVGQQQAWNTQFRQLRCEVFQVRTKESNAIRFALGADQFGLRNFVGFFINIIDRGNISAFLQDSLHFFQNVHKQHVLGALYDQGKAIAALGVLRWSLAGNYTA